MGRDVRRVPPTWEHPKDRSGNYVPLHDNFIKDYRCWHDERIMWEQGMVWSHMKEKWVTKQEYDVHSETYEDYVGDCPGPAEYMPDWSPALRTHYQMYETCSEGTPISPVMDNPEALAHWLADNGASSFGPRTASYEQWLACITDGGACSAVIDTAHGLISGVEAMHDSAD